MRLFGNESRLFEPGILTLRSSECNEEVEEVDESVGLVGFELENLLVVFFGSCESKPCECDLKKAKGATL